MERNTQIWSVTNFNDCPKTYNNLNQMPEFLKGFCMLGYYSVSRYGPLFDNNLSGGISPRGF